MGTAIHLTFQVGNNMYTSFQRLCKIPWERTTNTCEKTIAETEVSTRRVTQPILIARLAEQAWRDNRVL